MSWRAVTHLPPHARGPQTSVPVVDLSKAPGEKSAWGRPKLQVYAWGVVELLFVTNPWQISSGLRTTVLRWFGAEIGSNVIFRPRTRVRFPWNLHVGDRSWIGEGVWLHNQDELWIGSDVVISQDTFITTGSHAHRTDMALITKPVRIEDGAWITARCVVLGGARVGSSSVIAPMTVVSGHIPPNTIMRNVTTADLGVRFPSPSSESD